MEEDMLPSQICGNCLGDNNVQYDSRSGRRLCQECEPNPQKGGFVASNHPDPYRPSTWFTDPVDE